MIFSKNLLFFLLSTVILLSSCSKTGSSGTGGNNGVNSYLLHTRNFTGYGFSGQVAGVSSENLSYDKENNRVTDYLRYPETGVGFIDDTIEFKQAGNIITATYALQKISKKFFLNAHNLPDSLYYTEYSSKKIYSYNYSYDGSGHVTTKTETLREYFGGDLTGPPATKTFHFTWENGNMVKEETEEYVAIYSYDETALSARPEDIMLLYNPYQNEMPNKNILKKIVYTYPYPGVGFSTSFTYDSKGRVVTENQVTDVSEKILDRNNTYY